MAMEISWALTRDLQKTPAGTATSCQKRIERRVKNNEFGQLGHDCRLGLSLRSPAVQHGNPTPVGQFLTRRLTFSPP
jgi:hypothetical protein